jgi:hypothetical protein
VEAFFSIHHLKVHYAVVMSGPPNIGQIKEDEMVRAWLKYEICTKFWLESMKRRGCLEDFGIGSIFKMDLLGKSK